MKKIIIGLLALAVAGPWARTGRAEDGGTGLRPIPGGFIDVSVSEMPATGPAVEMLIFEGARDASAPSAKAVTASFLKFLHFTTLQPEGGIGTEQQIKQVFNLKDVRLINAVELTWEKGKPEKASHVFRLDGREYVILVAPARPNDARQFRIEVEEQVETVKTSLLDMEFTIPQKTAAVFGFEDTQGTPYFLSFKLLAAGAKTPGEGKGRPEFVPPKLVKAVDPVYPEIARQSRVQGSVVLEAATDVYGRVARVEVVRSIPLLDQASIDALRQWVYEPALVDGKPRPVKFTVTMRFSLEEGKAVTGGVMGGIVGGVEGGVQGGVAGGVQGGTQGGVQGGVIAGPPSKEEKEFEKGAVRAIGDIKPPLLLKSVQPVYPQKARQAQVEGVVILEARTDEKGRVEETRILRSIPVLDQAAVDAVKQWIYEPAIINGKPQKIVFTVTVSFWLTSGDKEKIFEKFAQGAVKAEGAIKPPKLIKIVEAVYPEEAKKAGVEGTVILSAKTDTAGRVQDVMILRSIPLLNQAAIDAVRQWLYEPMVVNGVPYPVVFTVTVNFKNPDKDKAKK